MISCSISGALRTYSWRWVCFNAYGVVVMMGGWCVPGHQSFQETMMEPAYKWDYHMALQPISFCSWFGGPTAAWLVHWVFSASLSTRYSLYKMLPWCTNLIPLSCHAGHFIIFFFFTSRKKDCFRVSVCILTSSNFVFCCNPSIFVGFPLVVIWYLVCRYPVVVSVFMFSFFVSKWREGESLM